MIAPTGSLGRSPALAEQSAPCACGQWSFREFTLNDSVAALERYCPRCRSIVLLVFRRGQHVGSVVVPDSRHRVQSVTHLPVFRASLRRAGLTEPEVEILMRVAEGAAS